MRATRVAAQTAFIGVAAIVAIPVIGRLMQTDLYQKAEEIPLLGVPLKGARAWTAQLFNP